MYNYLLKSGLTVGIFVYGLMIFYKSSYGDLPHGIEFVLKNIVNHCLTVVN